MKNICIVIIALILLCSCSQNNTESYTVDSVNQYRNIVGYGIVACNKTVKEQIPAKAKDISLNVAVGNKIIEGEQIASYNINGTTHQVTAKFNGIVTKIDNYCIEYYELNCLTIVAKISESDATKLSEGMTASITGVGFEKEFYSGKIQSISSVADRTASGVYIDCVISFDEPDFSLIPGFSAKVEITVAEEGQVFVPLESLKFDGRFYVYKIVDGKYVKTNVTNSTVCGNLCAVSGQIEAGDIIAVNYEVD